MKIIEKKIIDLIDAEYNPRQLTEKQYEDLEQSINKFGFVDPIKIERMLLLGVIKELKLQREWALIRCLV